MNELSTVGNVTCENKQKIQNKFLSSTKITYFS